MYNVFSVEICFEIFFHFSKYFFLFNETQVGNQKYSKPVIAFRIGFSITSYCKDRIEIKSKSNRNTKRNKMQNQFDRRRIFTKPTYFCLVDHVARRRQASCCPAAAAVVP